MKKSLLFALAIASGISTIPAATPSDESINEMIKVMEVEKTVNMMVAQMENGIKTGMQQSQQQVLQGKEPTPEQKAFTEKFQQQATALLKDELSFSKMKDVYLQVYRETFTQDEVNSIIAFYGSPAGKAMVQKIPVAMQKAGVLMQGRMGPLTQKMQKMQADFTAEMSKTK
jgi:hypothetical protein